MACRLVPACLSWKRTCWSIRNQSVAQRTWWHCPKPQIGAIGLVRRTSVPAGKFSPGRYLGLMHHDISVFIGRMDAIEASRKPQMSRHDLQTGSTAQTFYALAKSETPGSNALLSPGRRHFAWVSDAISARISRAFILIPLITAFTAISGLTSARAQTFSDGLSAFNVGNYSAAYSIWLPLAQQGDANCQSSLGYLFHLGKGVSQNSLTAAKWYDLPARASRPLNPFSARCTGAAMV